MGENFEKLVILLKLPGVEVKIITIDKNTRIEKTKN
jgi:hypothetical protein